MKRSVLAVAAVCLLSVVACGDDGGGSVEAFCASFQDLSDSDEFFNIEVPENFETGFAESKEMIDAVADNAPDEISDDAETVARIYGEMMDALADVDPADEEALLEALAPIDEDPELAAAFGNLDEFILTECGIDLDESG